MTELLTAAEMRSVEGAAIDSGAASGLELMERAGAGVVNAVLSQWPDLSGGAHSAVVLCGPGNNGGDGFVVARLLTKAGWTVRVFLYGDPDKLPPDARTNFERWIKMGRVTAVTADVMEDRSVPGACDLLVDALFGTGLGRAISLPLQKLGRNPKSFRTVAVDIPSGLCSDSGRIIGSAEQVLRADLTVSFHRAKVGHMIAQGPEISGTCVIVDIGL